MRQVLHQISSHIQNLAYNKIEPVINASNRDRIQAAEDMVEQIQLNIRWPLLGGILQGTRTE